MKKLYPVFLTCLLYPAICHADGWLTFAASKNAVWDGFTTPGVSVPSSGTVNVGFIWAASGTAAIIAAAGGGSPTNSAGPVVPNPWNVIMNDPNFHFAQNGNTSALVVQTSNTANISRGGWGYLGGTAFPVTGTPATPIQIVVIGWSSQYATPQLAAAAGSAVGWSGEFTYNMGASGTDPNASFTFSTEPNGMQPFGLVVPEPSTLAFTGLGAAALLLFRRRK